MRCPSFFLSDLRFLSVVCSLREPATLGNWRVFPAEGLVGCGNPPYQEEKLRALPRCSGSSNPHI